MYATLVAPSCAPFEWRYVRLVFLLCKKRAGVYNLSEYVNANDFYLFTCNDICKVIIDNANRNEVSNVRDYNFEFQHVETLRFWWKEIVVMIFTSAVSLNFLVIVPSTKSNSDNKYSDYESTSNSRQNFSSSFQRDFDMVRLLGRGSFGVIFEVKSKKDGYRYAIKRITLPNEEESRVRVMREVITLANCKHPNIVRYIQSWTETPPPGWQEEQDRQQNDRWQKEKRSSTKKIPISSDCEENKIYLYIQMELCCSYNLRDWLESCELESRDYEIPNFFHQIVDAVAYIHSKGLIHRDLKPMNIFISKCGLIKVGDFGLVTGMADKPNMIRNDETCSSSSRSHHTQGVGTTPYMSPEQLRGLPYNHKVDIYSLGLIFFELLVYFGTDMERSKTLRSLRDGVYPDKMLSATPGERPAIEDVKEHINEILKIPSDVEMMVRWGMAFDLYRAGKY
uniref:Protein kinase domain-containing protein n=1 Tax=Glossina palpalis gambiensis TaxID=67801 RepID=A0A1B0BSV7_9MUSC